MNPSFSTLKERSYAVKEIASELNVAHILEGSISRMGDMIRVSAHLIKTESDQQIWAKTLDRQLGDIFQLQSEVSREITYALKGKISLQKQKIINRVPTENLEAYENYMQGKHFSKLRSKENLEKSEGFLIVAIGLL